MKNCVKMLVMLLLVPLVNCLTGCSPSAEEMLIGRWKLECAIERMSDETNGEVRYDTLQGYDQQEMTFMDDANCIVVDRGDTTLYRWSLTSGDTLVLWNERWAEDYAINQLTKQRLVYSDTYRYYDSTLNKQYNYKYRFEYKKL